jgi:hypothetical protein
VQQQQAHARQQIEDQQQRHCGSGPAHGLDCDIAGAPPEHHRHQKETLRAQAAAASIHEVRQRQDAVAADQSECLDSEGDEGAKVDQPEAAQEQVRDQLVTWRAVIPSPQEQADAVERRAVCSGEGIGELRDCCESGQFSVERKPQRLAARVAQRQEARLSGARHSSVGGNVLHGVPEVRWWDLGKLRCHLLVWSVADTVAGELLPIARPIATESTIAVIDEERVVCG